MATRGKGIIFHIVYLYFVLHLLSMKFHANASKSDRRKCQDYPINATDTKEDVLQKRIACRSLFKLYPRSTRKSSVVRTQQRKMFPFVGRRHHDLAKPSRPKRYYARPFYHRQENIPVFRRVMPFAPDLPITTTEDTPLPWTTRKFDFIIVREFQPFVPTPGQPPIALTDPCLSGPCINKGTCTRDLSEGQRGYICTCPSEFRGHHCEEGTGELTNPCLSGPCLNKGTCTRDLSKGPHGYICTCSSGFQGHHCEEEIKQYTVTEDSLLEIEDLIVGAIGIWALISLFVIVHCVRVSRQRSELVKDYKKKLESGDILPLPPPDWCDVSNALCQSFFCYCCRNCGDESDSEQAVPLLERYQDNAQKKEDELKRMLNRNTEDVLRKVSSRSLVPGSVPQGPPGRRLSSSDQVTPLMSQVYESYPGTSQAETPFEEDSNSNSSEDDEDDEEEDEASEEDSEEDDREEGENKEREELECYFDAENKMGGGMQAVLPTGNANHMMMTHNAEKIDNFNQRQTYGGNCEPQRNSFHEMRNINNQASNTSFIYEYPYDRRMSAYYKYRQQRQSSMYQYNKNSNHFFDQHVLSQQKEHESHPAEQSQQSSNPSFPGMQIQDSVNDSYSHHFECDQQQQNSSENIDLVKSDSTDLFKCQAPSFYRPWTRAEHKLSKVSPFHIPSPSPTAVTRSQPQAGHSKSDKNKSTSSDTGHQNRYSESFGNRHKSGNTNTAAPPTSEIEQNNARNIPLETETTLPNALTHKQVLFANHRFVRAHDRTQEDSTHANLVSMDKFAQQNHFSFRNPPINGEHHSFATHGNYADLSPSTSSHFSVLPEPSRNVIAQDDDQNDIPSTPSNIPVMFVPSDSSSPIDTHFNKFTSKSKDDSGMFVSSMKTTAQESYNNGMPSVSPTTRGMPPLSNQPLNDESSKNNTTVLKDSPKAIYIGETKTKGLILMRRFRFDVTDANTNSDGSQVYCEANLPSDCCNNSHINAYVDFGDGVRLHKINERTRSKNIMDASDYNGLKDEGEDVSNFDDMDIDFNLISFDDDHSDPYVHQCSSNLLKASAEFSEMDQMRPSNDSEGQTITVDLNESISRFMNQSFGLESDTSTIVEDDNHLLGRSRENLVHIIDFSELTQSLQ